MYPSVWSFVKLLRLIVSLLAAFLVPATANAACDDVRDSDRVALVIGNSSYLPGQWNHLANARNDAETVCDGFAGQGFRVIKVVDADRDGMARAIAEFARIAPQSDVALFYFAGHGFEYAGINWLVPVDAPAETARAWLAGQFIDLATILNAVKQSRHGIVFLDACRTRDPVVRIRDADPDGPQGPAGTINLPDDFEGVVFYSTARGASAFDAAPVDAKNSPFAQAVVERLEIPDLELMRYFAFVRADVKRRTTRETGGPQIPTPYGLLGTEFYFNRPPGIDDVAPEPVVAAAPVRPAAVRPAPVGGGTATRPAAARAPSRTVPPGQATSPGIVAPGGRDATVPTLARKFEGMDPGRARSVLASLDRETLAKEDEPQVIARVLGEADAGSLAALAESGDPTAQYLYGAMLYLGLGVVKDLPASRTMLERAAASGTAAGMLEYGYFLETFGDRPGDRALAAQFYEKAAATGYGKAQAHLAYRLWHASPPERNETRALSLWSDAAAQGYPYAIYATGVYGGRMSNARQQLSLLADKGDRAADGWLCELAEYEGNAGAAFEHCLKAAQDGIPGSMAVVARLFREGSGVALSNREAEYWARMALAQPDYTDPFRRPQTEALLQSLGSTR